MGRKRKQEAPAPAINADEPLPKPPAVKPQYANGRQAALQCLDSMLADPTNMQALGKDMQELFNLSPTKFFQDFVMPLTPKESLMTLKGGDKASPVRILMGDEDAEES